MYRIHIEKQKLNFSAAHFITYEDECETLHGHNYYTTIDIYGQPDENYYLIDFKIIKNEMKVICDSLNHKFIIATENRNLDVKRVGGQYEISFKSKRYSFPAEDVVALPIPNTTAEMLSKYICEKLKDVLDEKGYLSNAGSIEVGVEETQGQMASCKIDL
ncbi:MAG: 6-pyruvoyl tetrahydropterin synthase family protein [Nitrospinota bacterium]